MRYYIVRHKESGSVLPAGVLATSWEFTQHTLPPRLFSKQAHANACIRAWAKGWWKRVQETDGSWEEGYYTYFGTPAPVEKDLHRKAEDLEAVPVDLVEVVNARPV